MRRIRATTATAALLLLLAACGGSDNGPQAPSGGGAMTAQINGAAWSAGPTFSSAQYNEAAEVLTLTGISLGSYSMAITLAEITGPGPVTFTATVPLRFAVVTIGSDPGWGSTYQTGGGSLSIATFTADRITGTFQFTAWPSPTSSQTGELVVTSGQFDLALIRL